MPLRDSPAKRWKRPERIECIVMRFRVFFNGTDSTLNVKRRHSEGKAGRYDRCVSLKGGEVGKLTYFEGRRDICVAKKSSAGA